MISIMDAQFLSHNSHLESPDEFSKRDPQLRRLSQQTYVYHSPLIDNYHDQRRVFIRSQEDVKSERAHCLNNGCSNC